MYVREAVIMERPLSNITYTCLLWSCVCVIGDGVGYELALVMCVAFVSKVMALNFASSLFLLGMDSVSPGNAGREEAIVTKVSGLQGYEPGFQS